MAKETHLNTEPAGAVTVHPGSSINAAREPYPWPLPKVQLRVPSEEDRDAVMQSLRVAVCPECGNRELVIQEWVHQWECGQCRRAFQTEAVAYGE